MMRICESLKRFVIISFALFLCAISGDPLALADTKRLTPLEASNYQRLPKSAKITAFLDELAQGSPYAKTLWLGRSAGDRAITALLVSKDSAFLNESVTADGKLTVMLVGSQHGTEPSGAEALQAIARDLLHGDLHPYLDDMDIILLPNANPDSRDSRRRGNANEVNLSTDFIALSQPESRAMCTALKRFEPHVLLDIHESAILKKQSLYAQGYLTDFEAQFEIANHPNIDVSLRAFSLEVFLPDLLKAINAQGLHAGRYIDEITDLGQPIEHGGVSLRNLRNYAGFRGAFSILVENRLDPPGDYRTPRNIGVRVAKQTLSVGIFLQKLQLFRKEILKRVSQARSDWMNEEGISSLALVSRYATHPSQSKITIPLRKRETGGQIDKIFDYHGNVIAEIPLTLPAAYAVTARQEFIGELLDRHDIRYEIIPQTKQVHGIRQCIKKIEITPPPSGRGRNKVVVRLEEEAAKISLVPGDLWIDLDQPAGRLVPLIFDPRSTSSIFHDPAYTIWLTKSKYFFVARMGTENTLGIMR